MKKILLIVLTTLLTFSLNSCSSDSGGSGSSLSFKVNGVEKKFKVVPDEDTGFLFVYGYIGNEENPSESVQFNMPLNSDSTINLIESFIYFNPDEVNGSTTLLSNVTSKTANSVEGTFSGNIINISGGASDITITDGKFSFNY